MVTRFSFLLPLMIIALNSQNLLGGEKVEIRLMKGRDAKKEQIDTDDGKINCDFPEPTDIRDISRAFSLWFNRNYVVDDNVKAKVKLPSPERVTKPEALKRFHKMLAQYHLKAVESEDVIRIEAAGI